MRTQIAFPVSENGPAISAKGLLGQKTNGFQFNIEGTCTRNIALGAAAIIALLAGSSALALGFILILVMMQLLDFVRNLFSYNMDFELGSDLSEAIHNDLISSERA